jgi:hypothetical protein
MLGFNHPSSIVGSNSTPSTTPAVDQCRATTQPPQLLWTNAELRLNHPSCGLMPSYNQPSNTLTMRPVTYR